uniref:Uncharacterized protein n=1 Tax=uncultured Thiotrichaceae bacterium TaxID=298394 RepID=A0A6S6U2S3_9GAMM|nr:MAG: Unknown protein [uncultured Thiotrichaceae bacterium]
MPKEAESHEAIGKREQMEWDRLQNEALAAQRYRLEQEIEQARADGLISGSKSGVEPFMGIDWSSKWVLASAVLALVGVGVSVLLLI